MNTSFEKVGIGRAENGEGAVVRGYAKEMLIYERGDFSLPFEINFAPDKAVVYVPSPLPEPPAGLSREELMAELMAGARVVARREVELGSA